MSSDFVGVWSLRNDHLTPVVLWIFVERLTRWIVIGVCVSCWGYDLGDLSRNDDSRSARSRCRLTCHRKLLFRHSRFAIDNVQAIPNWSLQLTPCCPYIRIYLVNLFAFFAIIGHLRIILRHLHHIRIGRWLLPYLGPASILLSYQQRGRSIDFRCGH